MRGSHSACGVPLVCWPSCGCDGRFAGIENSSFGGGDAMVEPEDVDLAKALSRLAKLLARTAQDIVTELENAERTHQVANALEQAAGQLRGRAQTTRPAVIVVD